MAYTGPTVKPGISGLNLSGVPKQWDAAWFRQWALNYLQFADVRNANAGAGISITGNIGTPPATIAVSADLQALFTQPYVLATSPSGISAAFDKYRLLTPQAGILTVTDGGAEADITVGVAANGIGNAQLRQGAALSVVGNATNALANEADIVGTTAGQLLCIDPTGAILSFHTVPLASTGGLGASFTVAGLTAGQVLRASGATGAAFAQLGFSDLSGQATLAQLPSVGADTVLGNITGGSAVPTALSQAQLTALVNTATTGVSGAVPAYPNSTTQWLRGDLTWASLPAYPVGANPSASVGLSAVNGSAATWMRSDGAPALSQAITPTWTGLHTFTPGGGHALNITAGDLQLNGSAGTSGYVLTSAGASALPTWTAPSAGANPSASVGLSAVNGSATTWMRSDGAPALSVAIVPTWTGVHTFKAAASGAHALFDCGAGGYTGCGWSVNGTLEYRAMVGWDAAGTLSFVSAATGATQFSLSSAGNVTVAAPSSGDALALTNVAGANALAVNGNSAGTAVVRLNTQATTGAQTATFAATNKPGSGTTSPDKWLPVNLDGTTHYIPCFL